ncbi:MAG: Chromosome partition protein Smc [Parcubacteria group bacterium GW2011_GWC1_45_9]|nr:MAG: Chromosome partition protein Smc [Parcubacteria group bacterium GW2011_GWC1_45_9]
MLKQLEIQGFKSFSDKTVLNFPEGITAVVGPNGSGKSNVVDAIRWVFGEQSSKNIRINSAEDVIFSGTPQKQASSSSQVSLLFDNRFKTFPLDFEEVEIRRKVYRDGASEYFLNKKQVRLKDLVQLLASAKLGLKGMSIINQGAADVFLRANSVERREMIEEMVGLKELRLKKEEAERKIKDSKLNLAQAETILNEIGPNLRSLKRQVERWRTRQEKEAELLVLEKDFFIKKIAELLKETNLSQDGKDEEKIKELENEINREQSSLKNFNQGATGHSGDRQKIQAKLESLQKQRFEILRTLGNLEGQLELLGSLPETELNFSLNDAKQKLEQVLETLESVLSSEEISSIKEKIAALTKSLKSFLTGSESRSHKESESKKQSLLDKKTELAQALDELEEKIVQEKQALADEEKEKNQSFASLIASLENKRKEMRVLEEKVLVSKVERERFKLRQEDLSLRLEEAGLSWDVFVKDNQARLEQAKSFGEDLGPFEKKILRLKNELSLIGEVDQETLKEYETISARFEFLSSQKSDLESALEDLEELSKSLEEKIVSGFEEALKKIDKEFQKYFGIIFDGGRAALKVEKVVDDQTQAVNFGIEISINLPRKKIKSLEMLSGGERSLTAVALLFAVINYARPPFLF